MGLKLGGLRVFDGPGGFGGFNFSLGLGLGNLGPVGFGNSKSQGPFM